MTVRAAALVAAFVALAAPASAQSQTRPLPASPAGPQPLGPAGPGTASRPQRPSQPKHRPSHSGTYTPAVYVDANQYLQPAPAPVRTPSHHAAPKKKTSSGEDVFETHSTGN